MRPEKSMIWLEKPLISTLPPKKGDKKGRPRMAAHALHWTAALHHMPPCILELSLQLTRPASQYRTPRDSGTSMSASLLCYKYMRIETKSQENIKYFVILE